jgi:hypothetical protein
MIKKLISGGQTGADRAAVDFAIKNNILYGGWIPISRKLVDCNLKFICFTVVTCFLLLFIYARPAISDEIEVDPTTADFGNVLLGDDSAAQIFTIRHEDNDRDEDDDRDEDNDRDEDDGRELEIRDIALSDTTNYSLDLNAGARPCASTEFEIREGGNCTVAVIFNPTEEGFFDGILRVTSDDRDEDEFDVDLTGRGVATADDAGGGIADGSEQVIDTDSDGGDDYDFTCFIGTVKIAPPMVTEWLDLILILGCGIFVLHKIRKKPLKL